jgi:hypothetical protein
MRFPSISIVLAVAGSVVTVDAKVPVSSAANIGHQLRPSSSGWFSLTDLRGGSMGKLKENIF